MGGERGGGGVEGDEVPVKCYASRDKFILISSSVEEMYELFLSFLHNAIAACSSEKKTAETAPCSAHLQPLSGKKNCC